MPALPITFNFLDFSITFFVAFVADLTTKASQSFNSSINSSSFRPVFVLTFKPLS